MQSRGVSLEEGNDSATTIRTNQSRVLPLRLLLFLLLFLGMFILFSILNMHKIRYFGSQNIVPRKQTRIKDCFQEPSSLESWIRPPSSLQHTMNDTQLLWRASFVPKLKEYPFKRIPKIAFMFLTRGPLPLAPLWERFLKGHEGLYSIYIHSLPSYVANFPSSSVFYQRQIPSQIQLGFWYIDGNKYQECGGFLVFRYRNTFSRGVNFIMLGFCALIFVSITIWHWFFLSSTAAALTFPRCLSHNLMSPTALHVIFDILIYSFERILRPSINGRKYKVAKWGMMSMCDAERRLLSNALLDISNEWFVLLSESCIPLHNFSIVYRYLSRSRFSFIGAFDDPGPHGRGRYNEKMAPDVNITQWRKGSQWFEVSRKLAVDIVGDVIFYPKFEQFCRPACYVDEHYFPTMLSIQSPYLLANRSVTWVDWSRGGAHPATFGKADITEQFFDRISTGRPCSIYNNQPSSLCILFARKFAPSALDPLLEHASKFFGY